MSKFNLKLFRFLNVLSGETMHEHTTSLDIDLLQVYLFVLSSVHDLSCNFYIHMSMMKEDLPLLSLSNSNHLTNF